MTKLEANITRFAPRDGFICDVDKHRKATEEDYDFRFISPGYYLCITEEGNAYTISEYKGKIGCGCADMTFNCKGKEVCKHLIAFMNLKDLHLPDISEEQAQLLKAAGWSGKKLSPPNRPKQRKKKLPNIHDPARKPQPQAATRADQHKAYASMTPEEILRETPQAKLETYANRGAPLAIAEVQRRKAEQAVDHQGTMTKRCGNCEHLDLLKKTHFGYYCTKTIERIGEFNKHNQKMCFMDKFRFAPDAHLRKEQAACEFFKERMARDMG